MAQHKNRKRAKRYYCKNQERSSTFGTHLRFLFASHRSSVPLGGNVFQAKCKGKNQTLQIHCSCYISLAFACFMCYTSAMKTSIQQAAAKSLIHQAIMAPTAGQAQIMAQAAATLNPSVNPTKIQAIWLAKFCQTKKVGSHV
jgi:hypothetical protein